VTTLIPVTNVDNTKELPISTSLTRKGVSFTKKGLTFPASVGEALKRVTLSFKDVYVGVNGAAQSDDSVITIKKTFFYDAPLSVEL